MISITSVHDRLCHSFCTHNRRPCNKVHLALDARLSHSSMRSVNFILFFIASSHAFDILEAMEESKLLTSKPIVSN